MKNIELLKFLTLLSEKEIKRKEDIAIILSHGEEVMNILSNSGKDFDDILFVIKVYSKTEDLLKALDILKVSRKEYYYFSVFKILTNASAIKNGKALEWDKFIKKAKEEFQANYVFEILKDEDVVKSGMALEIAKKVMTYDKDVLVEDYCKQYGVIEFIKQFMGIDIQMINYDNDMGKIFRSLAQKPFDEDVDPIAFGKSLALKKVKKTD